MLEITNTTRQRPYSKEADFLAIKNAILGKQYDLSLAFVGERRARALNEAHRQKTYVPNVLSFPLDDASGELFISPTRVVREAKHFDMTPAQYERFLFIHGCLHLLGLDHGPVMEQAEKKFSKRFLN
jgi:probable rRNA maturation factor